MNQPMFRPPAEADSLILQIDRGCPHNSCTFCGMYNATKYFCRPLPEVIKLIDVESRHYPGARRVFLADGDVFARPFEELRLILQALNNVFPRVSRINLYANGSSIAAKSAEQLLVLRRLRLHTLYMGLESGSEEILRNCRKRESAAQMVRAGVMAREAGLRMSVMVLLGLGGVDGSGSHIDATVAALNEMQPRLLSALRVVPVPGTVLHQQVQDGRFQQLSERGVVEELRGIIAGLELDGTVFRANHSSNVVPLEGRLPHDKQTMLALLERLLASGRLDPDTPGPLPLWL